MTPFCRRHLICFLNAFELSSQPLDQTLSRYFRLHKNLGASDRRAFGDTVYGMIRWKGLLDWLHPSSSTEKRLTCYETLLWDKIKTRADIPLPLRLGLSPFLYEKLLARFGAEETKRLATILNSPAPTTIRVNLLKISRDALFERWKNHFAISKCLHAPAGIQFARREPLFALPEFKEGLFEMQDEASQQISALIAAKPGDTILDYCSGSGGKSLAIAPSMEGKGQIYLHDVRPSVLAEAKKRLRRAGVQNAQCLLPSHPQMQRLLGKCDWVLVDVPCSGSGTIRRNVEQKWKIGEPMLQQLTALQQEILAKAISFVKPGGKLVYATCSLLPEENEEQIRSIPLTSLDSPLFLLPEEKGGDGFFGASFQK